MDHPLIFEINTRCWLGELSEGRSRPVTLDTVPEAEFAAWQNAGFTHIWLMGVWKTGPKARALARAQPDLQAMCRAAFGAECDDIISASPYAIADYVVAECFGGNAALRQFRRKLRQNGLGLILDFVPNHLGVDHPWLAAWPGLFVRSSEPRPECFRAATGWIAHGKDPNFPAWIDTAQLDYRVPATRAAMRAILQSVARQCDGVRCDMAMLPLEDVFAATWRDFPGVPPPAAGEFWGEAIAAVKQRQADFLFIAEAYWNRESRLQELGFDYVYDKRFYDCLARRDPAALRRHLQTIANNFCPVRFLENHDEPRLASILDFPEQQAAAVLLLCQPGMRLLHDGQLTGRKRRLAVQLTRYWPEPPHLETKSFYHALLAALAQTAIGGTGLEYLATEASGCFLVKWKGEGARCTLCAVNLAEKPAQFAVGSIDPGARPARTIFAGAESKWKWTGGLLQIELPSHGFLLLNL
jgi:glycosidase